MQFKFLVIRSQNRVFPRLSFPISLVLLPHQELKAVQDEIFWLTQVLRILPHLGRPEHGLKVIVLRCRGCLQRDGRTRVLGLASGEFIIIVLRRLLKRAPPRDKEIIWYHKHRKRKMSEFHILLFHSTLFISVSQRIKLLNLMLHLWELGQLLYSMSFSDIANNKGRFHCE